MNKRIIGIIAEYNPFHNGHAFLLQQAKIDPQDFIVVAMSGSFVQRGEVSFYDKWMRARWALENGADLVVELPTVFVLQSAKEFALGGVRLLSSLGCTHLCFGSEINDLSALQILASRIAQPSKKLSALVKLYLSKGYSFPRAQFYAYCECYPDDVLHSQILSQPNATLGISYLQAIDSLSSPLQPIVIARKGAGYHDTKLESTHASASGIRKALVNGKIDSVKQQVPADVFEDISRSSFAEKSALENILLYQLRSQNVEQLHSIFGMEEGLENLFMRNAQLTSVESILSAVKSKRYTQARLQRLLCAILLQINRSFVAKANQYHFDFAHVLGFRSPAQSILRFAKENNILCCMRKADFDKLEGISRKLHELDCFATDIQSLCFDIQDRRISQKDFLTQPVVI